MRALIYVKPSVDPNKIYMNVIRREVECRVQHAFNKQLATQTQRNISREN